MPALYVMIPAALLIVAVAIYIFFWAVDSGQYDDLDGPAHSVLFDDQDPQHLAAMQQAAGNKPEVHTPQAQTPEAGHQDEKPPHA